MTTQARTSRSRSLLARARPRNLLSLWLALLLLVALLSGWELYIDLGGADPLILPSPHAIAQSLYDDRSLLFSNFLATAEEVLLGIVVAAAAALMFATLIHRFAILRIAVYPLLIASQTIPIPILAPPLVLWLGFGILPKLVIISIISFFPLVVTTLAGFSSVDPDLIKLMQTFDAPRRRVFFLIELPSAVPGVFAGTKIAVIFAVYGGVIAEQAGSNSGLGYVVLQAFAQLEEPRAYAAVVIMSLFAISLFSIVTLAERLTVPWACRPIAATH